MPAAARLDPRRQLFVKRLRSLEPVLRKLRIDEPFRRLPQRVREAICFQQQPPPRVCHAAPSGADPRAEEVRAAVERALAEPLIRVTPSGELVSANEWFCTVLPLHIGMTMFRMDPRVASAVDRVAGQMGGTFVSPAWDDVDSCFTLTTAHVLNRLHLASRVDWRLYACSTHCGDDERGKATLTFRLFSRPCETRRITVDGEPRPAYRCGLADGRDVRWVTWPATSLGLPPGGPDVPVYVQGHVLHRAAQRLGVAGNQELIRSFVNYSLATPTIVRRDDRGYWVECRDDRDGRLGYLVGEVVEGGVFLVRTFLFLTMEGSPEADLLRRRLGARRADVTRLGLDQLSTYVETDLADDRGLADIFAGCGCGHLLGLRQRWGKPEARRLQAERVRAHFGLRAPAGERLTLGPTSCPIGQYSGVPEPMRATA